MESEITTASVDWDGEGQPISNQFGDVYFSKANGLEETRHVFLTHNQLAERWHALADTAHFTIAETGFGSGLNFLAAWDLWLKTAPASAQLHFITVEKYPLGKPDLHRALALWPELESLARQLIDNYPVIIETGFHRLNFMGGRIKLTLIIDDASAGLSHLLASTDPLFADAGAKVDAWFLDGFAPSKNPQMWSDALFRIIESLSHSQTTVATFSAAALVKNGLKSAGFSIQKVSGFGRKREMVKGIFNVSSTLDKPNNINVTEDFFNGRRSYSPYPIPWTINGNKINPAEKKVIVIGGGLAGCHTARALAERGWQVTVLERQNTLAQEGSGNAQGVLYAKLSPMNEVQAAFNLASLQYALHFYRLLWPTIGEQCGVLQLAYKNSETELHQLLHEKFKAADGLVQFVDADTASELAGIQLTQTGLFFPQAGWVDPRALCSYLIDHSNINVVYDFHVSNIQRTGNNWYATDQDDRIEQAPIVVIASAKDSLNFAQTNHLPIKAIRGQVTHLPDYPSADASQLAPPQSIASQHFRLKTVVCAEGYIAPAKDGIFCTGATFNLHDTNAQLRVEDHQTNIENLRYHLPAIAANWENVAAETLAGRVGFRCSLPDYLPVVGPLPVVDKMVEDFAPLRKNAKAAIAHTGTYLPGLYINTGHGARGLTYTPLCAELLAAQISDELLPVPTELTNALNPARFIIRDLTRNKR